MLSTMLSQLASTACYTYGPGFACSPGLLYVMLCSCLWMSSHTARSQVMSWTESRRGQGAKSRLESKHLS